MAIKILGTGCRNCVTLDRITREAVADLGLEASVEKVEDYAQVMAYGVMSTPALVIDERILTVGRVPTPTALRQLLTEAAAAHQTPDNPVERNQS
jgi:small redox-active disulfide protein 2